MSSNNSQSGIPIKENRFSNETGQGTHESISEPVKAFLAGTFGRNVKESSRGGNHETD